MFLLSLQSNQEKVWKFPKFFTDTYWLEGELHYIKYLKEAFILRPIKLFYQCLLSVIKNFLKFKKKIKSSLRYFWKKCDLFTPLFSQKNLIRIQSLRYIFLVLSIPIWVQWWLKFSTPLWKNLLLFLMSWVTLVYPQCDPSFFDIEDCRILYKFCKNLRQNSLTYLILVAPFSSTFGGMCCLQAALPSWNLALLLFFFGLLSFLSCQDLTT